MVTAIFKASLNDWQIDALILHDKVAIVEKHHAHLRTADGGIRIS